MLSLDGHEIYPANIKMPTVKTLNCSTEKSIALINSKMPTVDDILLCINVLTGLFFACLS